MRYSNIYGRKHIYIAKFHIEMLKKHINYELKIKNNWYHLSLPYNLFNKRLYGFYITPDGTPGNSIYYRPKRDWGLVEPNDPSYLRLINDTSRS